ncbi:DDB1- and CUL4-associated factor 11 [Neocloeon triangulifer]|uniref:DDB1- and CUL4-associated factor 11 n=1 Tax=Neocloeon triangulifer TaxID=2078957 RepID=UPI00286F246A|nr:DDB1- and CUL4-associated factor 11 [Neocloeon triangulifer]XP_059485877.1 DDB1- and CUL4-associated factor 11 [Neocloeon triangulifer]XP_059485878.1 DDB1- and CUL4-associated factor 11 [Neocloeon triangulifer]
MGSSSSRATPRMDEANQNNERNNDAVPEQDNEQDSDLATILQFLIRSGQIHIITAEHEETGGDDERALPPPKINHQPNTTILDKCEFSMRTKIESGVFKDVPGPSKPNSIPHLLQCREYGMFGQNKFSNGDRCKIFNNFLPNTLDLVQNYHNKAFCGTYSRQGDFFLSACQDRNLRLYDTSNGQFKLLKTIQARDVGWSILDTAFSPDGTHVVYSSWSECIHIVNLFGDTDNQEALPLSPDDRRFCIFSLAFSNDGNKILGGGNDGYIYLYDRDCQQRCLRIEGHDDDVNSVAFADSTSQILHSGGDDGLCKVWDTRTLNESNPKPVGILAGHMDGITFIDPKGDSRHLITNCKDQSIKLWDIRVFSPERGQDNTKQAVMDQNWDYRWQRVPKKLVNPRTKLEGDTSIMTYRGHSVLQTLVRCRFSPAATTGQRYIYTGCAAGRVIVYDSLTGKIERTLSGHRGCVRDVSWHPFNSEIISTSWDGYLGRWTYEVSEQSLDELAEVEPAASPSLSLPRRSQRLVQKMLNQLPSSMNVD